MRQELTRQLRGDEGVKSTVYTDSLGYATIGVGRLVDPRKTSVGLRQNEIDFMLNNDIDDRINALMKALPWFQNLDSARQGALLNMSFQLGVEGLLAFKNTLALVEKGDYQGAAAAMLDSKWAQQTFNRAKRLADQMKTGVWQYAPGA